MLDQMRVDSRRDRRHQRQAQQLLPQHRGHLSMCRDRCVWHLDLRMVKRKRNRLTALRRPTEEGRGCFMRTGLTVVLRLEVAGLLAAVRQRYREHSEELVVVLQKLSALSCRRSQTAALTALRPHGAEAVAFQPLLRKRM
jgi:hypothetical protein